MKHKIFIILLLASYNTVSISQNLDSIPAEKRDSLLIAIAKEVVLKYGPDYYREDSIPKIERHLVPPKGEINKTGENAGRVLYWVIIPYDEKKEKLEKPFAARIQFWADTGNPVSVFFGNGLGRIVSESVLRGDEEVTPVKYQQRQVIPMYSLDDPDPNRKPLNFEELKQKGYEEIAGSGGQWYKTTPDVPPHKRK